MFFPHGKKGKVARWDDLFVYHGHGGKRDEVDKDIEKFFRYVDSFVLSSSRVEGKWWFKAGNL